MSSFRRQSGFSYLWLLFMVALIGIGMAAVGEQSGIVRQRAQERQLLFAGHQIREAIQQYRGNTPAGRPPEYPAKLEDLLDDRRNENIRHHLRRLYRDPITGTTDWGVIILDGRIAGVYSRSMERPARTDNFAASDAAFTNAQHYSDWQFTYPVRLPADGVISLR